MLTLTYHTGDDKCMCMHDKWNVTIIVELNPVSVLKVHANNSLNLLVTISDVSIGKLVLKELIVFVG